MAVLRSGLDGDSVTSRSSQVIEKVLVHPYYEKADVILTYVSLPKEVQTFFLIEDAFDKGKKVAVPRIEKSCMVFKYIIGMSELTQGTMGILEPSAYAENVDIAEEIQKAAVSVIMPGVAFDEARNRIGYGGGFYDKFLHNLSEETRGRVKLIAPAFDIQVFDRLPADQHDVKPDIIITESKEIR